MYKSMEKEQGDDGTCMDGNLCDCVGVHLLNSNNGK